MNPAHYRSLPATVRPGDQQAAATGSHPRICELHLLIKCSATRVWVATSFEDARVTLREDEMVPGGRRVRSADESRSLTTALAYWILIAVLPDRSTGAVPGTPRVQPAACSGRCCTDPLRPHPKDRGQSTSLGPSGAALLRSEFVPAQAPRGVDDRSRIHSFRALGTRRHRISNGVAHGDAVAAEPQVFAERFPVCCRVEVLLCCC